VAALDRRPEAGGPDGCPGHECTLKIYQDAGWICFLKQCIHPPTSGRSSFRMVFK
jgi:hypothetical protein